MPVLFIILQATYIKLYIATSHVYMMINVTRLYIMLIVKKFNFIDQHKN